MTYDFFLDTRAEPENKLAEDIEITTFKVQAPKDSSQQRAIIPCPYLEMGKGQPALLNVKMAEAFPHLN